MTSKQTNKYEPPEHLSENSRALWCEIVPKQAKSPGRLALLAVALEALDRARQAQKVVDAEGMISKEEGAKMAHVHPALKIEKDARAQFLTAWKQLALSWNCRIDGR